MFKCFYPTYTMNSTYEINFDKIYDSGIRGLIFDIDNTLVGHDKPADNRAIELLKHLREKGFTICLLSNNHGSRVYAFNEQINALVVCDAKKPSGSGYIRAISEMNIEKEKILAIGDQLFTDIWGANRAGLKSILVNRLFPKETKLIYIKRFLEKFVWLFYKKSMKKQKKNTNI